VVGIHIKIVGNAEPLRQRADVRSAEYQVSAARARVGQARAARWPDFSIGGSLGLSSLALASLTDGASAATSLLASVALPIFDAGEESVREPNGSETLIPFIVMALARALATRERMTAGYPAIG
jgi:hypothetical protein